MLSQMEIEQRKANVETKKKAGNSELSMFMESHLYVSDFNRYFFFIKKNNFLSY